MPNAALHDLAETVQYNCHVSDARHGAEDSLCVYLMKMREYFRWEKRLPYGAALARDEVGEWLQAREELWEGLAEAEMRPILIDGQAYDPYDAESINAHLEPLGLVYSGGLGRRAKPHFVLGDLEQRRSEAGYSLFVVAGEYARDLSAPPAMTLGQSVFVRRESLRRVLWERLESWRWNRPDNALGRAFACYDFDGDLMGALDAMTEREIHGLMLHEQGEQAAGLQLGERWNRMLLDLAQTPAELMARGVRDHLADALVTLPALAEADGAASLHFYLGNLTEMRKHLFPKLLRVYEGWLGHGDNAVFAELAGLGREHWARLASEMLGLYEARGADAAGAIRDLAESRRL